MRRRAVFAVLAILLLVGFALHRPTGYPGDWPRPASSLFARRGGCPDVSGDYDDVPPELLRYFGKGSSRDRWSHHHARLALAEDGSTLRIDFGLNSTGMRIWLGEMGEQASPGLGRGATLRKGTHYWCRGGWIVSATRPGSEGNGVRYEDLRMAKDRSGALIVGDTISREGSIGWGDSRRISIGRSKQHRWYRWVARGTTDDAFVASLERVRLSRAPWINKGRSVPTFFANYQLMPICARLVREWRTIELPPVVTRADTVASPADPEVLPARCPPDSGRLGAMRTTIWQVDIPSDTDDSRGPPRIEWQRLDALDQPWHRIEIDDVRLLPHARI